MAVLGNYYSHKSENQLKKKKKKSFPWLDSFQILQLNFYLDPNKRSTTHWYFGPCLLVLGPSLARIRYSWNDMHSLHIAILKPWTWSRDTSLKSQDPDSRPSIYPVILSSIIHAFILQYLLGSYYSLGKWRKIMTQDQLLVLGTIITSTGYIMQLNWNKQKDPWKHPTRKATRVSKS